MLRSRHNKRPNESVSQRIIALAILAFPFIDIFLFRGTFRLFSGPLGYGPFICMYALLPVFVTRYPFPVRVIVILTLVGVVGSLGVSSGVVEQREFIKILGGLILSYTYYWYLWHHHDKNPFKIFRLYVNGAIAVSFIGLLTFLDSIVSFGFYGFINSFIRIGYLESEFGIRVGSTLGEPTYFASTIAPAGLLSLASLFFKNRKIGIALKKRNLLIGHTGAVTILLALITTSSAIAFTGLLLSLLMLLVVEFKFRAGIIVIPIAVALPSIVSINTDVASRFSGLQSIITDEDKGLSDVHGSSAILYNHAHITWENFRRNPIFGTGLGSHPEASKRFGILFDTERGTLSEWNVQDASSMFLRIASELGLFGILLVLYFLHRNFFSLATDDASEIVLKVISLAFLTAILLNLFRQGNFILNGFPFFVYGYYFTRKQFESNQEMKLSSAPINDALGSPRILEWY